MSEPSISCSVIILAWQDSEMTIECLVSLGKAAQIIVVDNGSDETYAKALEDACSEHDAHYIRAPRNLGFAGGMNLGLNAADRDVVIFSNNDIVASPEAIAGLTEYCFEPGVGAVFPSVVDGQGRDSTASGRFLTLGRSIAHAFGLTLNPRSRFRLEAELNDADWFSGPFVAMRRQLAVAIGGVPSQSFMYSEDYRLCWELVGLNLPPRLEPRITVQHLDDASALKRWSSVEIASLQTRELVIAAAQHQPTLLRGKALAAAYVFGTWWRYSLRPNPLRKAVWAGAGEGYAFLINPVRRRFR